MDNCPNCGVSLVGGSIWETFFEKYNDEAEADRIAEMYGATRTEGNWGKAIGIYSMEKDRTIGWQCPECNHEWGRT